MTTSKLDFFQRGQRKIVKKVLINHGGELFSFPDERITVLVCPSIGGSDRGNFCRVSIAYCDHADKFRRKVGEHMVLQRFDNGQSFAVPFMGRTKREVANDVICMLMGW